MAGAHYSSKLTWNGPKVTGAIKTGARAGVRKAGEYLLTQAVPKAPKDSGALRASGRVSGVNAEPIALVSFNTPYAVIQHENETYHHDDGQAKYLEEPLVQESATMTQIVATAVREAILGA